MNTFEIKISNTPEGRIVHVIHSWGETAFRRSSPSSDNFVVRYNNSGPWVEIAYPRFIPAKVKAALDGAPAPSAPATTTRTDDNAAYRRDMIDAGRGHLLR